MPNSSKQKGSNFERELVNEARGLGIKAERAYASNGHALGEVKEVDVLIGGVRIQAKRRKALAKFLKIPEGVDLVVFREDRGDTYALVRWKDILQMIQKEEICT